MSYFLAPVPLASGLLVTLEGEEAAHLLRSRRIRAGERIALQGPDGRRFAAQVARPGRREVTLQVLDPLPVPAPPPVRLTLLLAAAKEKALELVLQKVTELGAAEIVVFPAAHSPLARAELESPRTLARWERILKEACKQCDRQFPPALRAAPGLAEALVHGDGAGLRLVLDPRAGREAGSILQQGGWGGAAALLVGPEGGLTEGEIARAAQGGFLPARLGEAVLRAETAAIAITALVLLGCPQGHG